MWKLTLQEIGANGWGLWALIKNCKNSVLMGVMSDLVKVPERTHWALLPSILLHTVTRHHSGREARPLADIKPAGALT